MPHRWSKAAKIRKEQIETGVDITFHKVFLPLYEHIIHRYSPISVMDVGAGTGHLALHLRQFCESLVAIEPSQGMYDVAKDTLKNCDVELVKSSSYTYTNSNKFDMVYSHMCAHTIESLSGFLSSINSFVKTDGLMILSIPHPLFYDREKDYFGDCFQYMEEMHCCVDLTISKDKENKIYGVPFYHRPISQYVNSIIESGFDLVEMKEVFLSLDEQEKYGVSWSGPRFCFFLCSVK